MAKDVAKAKDTEVAVQADYGQYTKQGFEDTSLDDLSIPFIKIMQPTSPEVTDQTIEGISAGDLVNSVTNEIVKQPLIVQPFHKESAAVEWVPRNKGGGMVGRHELDGEIFMDAVKANGGSRIPPKDAEGKRIPFKSPDGNELVETYYVYCLVLSEEGNSIEGFCVLSFASTNITIYKKWLTSMYSLKGAPPIFANRCKVSTKREKNDSGTYYIYQINAFNETYAASLIPPSEDWGWAMVEEGARFEGMVKGGLARPAEESLKNSGAAPDSGAKNDLDGTTPF